MPIGGFLKSLFIFISGDLLSDVAHSYCEQQLLWAHLGACQSLGIGEMENSLTCVSGGPNIILI